MDEKSTKRLIYFCGSIRGGRDDVALYRRIIDQLKQYGDVLTEHIGDVNLVVKDQGQLEREEAVVILLTTAHGNATHYLSQNR